MVHNRGAQMSRTISARQFLIGATDVILYGGPELWRSLASPHILRAPETGKRIPQRFCTLTVGVGEQGDTVAILCGGLVIIRRCSIGRRVQHLRAQGCPGGVYGRLAWRRGPFGDCHCCTTLQRYGGAGYSRGDRLAVRYGGAALRGAPQRGLHPRGGFPHRPAEPRRAAPPSRH